MRITLVARLLAAVCCLVLATLAPAIASPQSVAVRAQGHYYSAKEAYLGKRYDRALDYVYKSKEALGGTNQQLQHLHVFAAYTAGRYTEAQREMDTFFKLTEKVVPEVRFSRSVQPLTNDEVTELTKLINKIDEGVAAQAAAERLAAEHRAAAEVEARKMAAWTGQWTGTWSGGGRGKTPSRYWLTLRHTGGRSFTGTFRWQFRSTVAEMEQDLRGTMNADGTEIVMRASPMRVISGRPGYNYRSGEYSFRLFTPGDEPTMFGTIHWPDPIYEGEGQGVTMKRGP